jgi:hypothetical protein|nr:MAG TPA: hypothetical protein [Caudoviricetes sp.]
MNIEHVASGSMSELFTDVDNDEDYAVAPWDIHGWEHLYIVVDIDSAQIVRDIDGATPEEALRNWLEHGQGAVCRLMTVYHNGTPIDRLDRPGCDTEYKVRGIPIVCTVKRGATPFEWRLSEDGSDKWTIIQAGSPAEAVLEYITKKEGEHNA